MEKLIGVNKPLQEQMEVLEEILLQNKKLRETLIRLQKTSLKNYSYYIGAGAINQTIFNYYHDYPLDYGIKDFDIVYFNADTSYTAEDRMIKEVEKTLKDIDVEFDIKNEARVHLWYNEKYQTKRNPYTSVKEAISRWGATITCIGVRMENNHLIILAPYGLNDIFNMIIRPTKIDFTKEQYEERANRWKEKWPLLKILPWSGEEDSNE